MVIRHCRWKIGDYDTDVGLAYGFDLFGMTPGFHTRFAGHVELFVRTSFSWHVG